MRLVPLALLLAVPAFAAPKKPMLIVALGDSTTAGTPAHLSPLEAPPDGKGDPESQFSYWMTKAHPEWTVLNRGINGERADQIRARFKRDVEDAKPAMVIILAGVNDVYQGRSAEATQLDLAWMYARAKELGIVPVAATVLPFDRATADQNRRRKNLNTWIRRHAQAQGIPFCNTARASADSKDPNKLKASPDGLHPDAATYRAVGEALAKVVGAIKL